MAKTQIVEQTTTQSNIPEYARPYFEDALSKAQGIANRQYVPYGYETTSEIDPQTGQYKLQPKQGIDPATGKEYGTRIADFTSLQNQVQKNVGAMGPRSEFNQGANLATASGLMALNAGQYSPGSFDAGTWNHYQMGPVSDIQAQQYDTPQMRAAQTRFAPQISQYTMADPGQFSGSTAQQYMSPYAQNVIDVQKSEAIRDAQKGQLAQNLGAARQGTYGGSRQLLATMERERNLGQQLGNIQATGLQSAYENAQQQYQRDRDAQMQAGQTNINSLLQTQGLGVNTGLQTALANLNNRQQAGTQNLGAQLQTQGLNANQYMQAALANQQKNYNIGNTNLNANLTVQQQRNAAAMEAQRLMEQSRQYGAQMGLQGAQQAAQSGQTLANIGQMGTSSDLSIYNAQNALGQQQQQLDQTKLDTSYNDFLRQRDYPMENLNFYSGILRGFDVKPNSTVTTYGQAPSAASQIGGLGLGALSLYNMAKGP